MWNPAVAHLRTLSNSCTIELLDFPGFGSTPFVEGWSMKSFATMLAHKLDEAGIEDIMLGGCSMGGYAALAFYKQFPERVSALILSDTKAAADTEAAKEDREVFARDVELRGAIAVTERMLPKFLVGDSDLNPPSRKERLSSWIEQANPVALAQALRAMASREDTTTLLPSIDVPTLVIAGESDPIMPARVMNEMADEIFYSSFVLMQSTGHLAPFDQPKQWASHVANFLSDFHA